MAEISETKTATEMCLSRLVEAFDARTGARVQELLDSLYKDGYTQQRHRSGDANETASHVKTAG